MKNQSGYFLRYLFIFFWMILLCFETNMAKLEHHYYTWCCIIISTFYEVKQSELVILTRFILFILLFQIMTRLTMANMA